MTVNKGQAIIANDNASVTATANIGADASELEKLIAEKCGEERDNIIDQINTYSCVIEEIYFNLGMKAGVTLHSKLTDNFETDI